MCGWLHRVGAGKRQWAKDAAMDLLILCRRTPAAARATAGGFSSAWTLTLATGVAWTALELFRVSLFFSQASFSRVSALRATIEVTVLLAAKIYDEHCLSHALASAMSCGGRETDDMSLLLWRTSRAHLH